MAKKAVEKVPQADDPIAKRKPGRRPMTTEEKEAAAKARAEEKDKAAHLKPEIIVQYQGGDVNMSTLVEAAKADFHKTKKRILITGLTLYVKPEEHMVYYVVNENYEGKVPY